jgi:DNA-binding transcriptional LysR family regulator
MGMVIDSNNVRLISLSGEGQNVKLSGRILFDHGLAAKSALQAGRGFGVTHRWLIDDLLESGELIRLLPDYQLTVTPLSLLIAPERADIARVRCLIDFLIERIRLIPGIL